MEITWKIHGLEELKSMLDMLPASVDRRIAGNALRAGARVMRDAIKEVTPHGDKGELKASVKVITRKQNRRDERYVNVGFFGKPSSLAHLLEYGTVPIRRSTSGKKLVFVIDNKVIFRDKVKGVIANPFVRRTADRVTPSALGVIGKVLGEQLDKEFSRTGAKFRK